MKMKPRETLKLYNSREILTLACSKSTKDRNSSIHLIRNIPELGSFKGMLFEITAHHKIYGAASHLRCKLVTQGSEQECGCVIPQNSMPLVESLEEIKKVGVYYKPTNKRYGAIDSLFFIQNTIKLLSFSAKLL